MNAVIEVKSQNKTVRVQIVEDERIVALDLKFNLQQLGFVVTGMANSEGEALAQVRRERPDVVLMDINLGRGGDGIQAAQQLKDEFGVPVIFLTAYAEPETLERAGLSAPYGYLLKPFELRELNATIRMALARREVEQRTERLEQRFRLALDAARLGVVEFHRNTDAVELDGHIAHLMRSSPLGFKFSRDEFLARLVEPAVRERLSSLLLPGGVVHTLALWQRDDEELIWLEIHACHFVDEDKVIGVFRDVTTQVNNEERLQQAAVVFESATEAIVILDGGYLVRAANPAFTALTGWAHHEVLGRHPDDFLHAKRSSDRMSARESLAAGAAATPWHGDVYCLRRDGSLFPAWEHVAPVMGKEQEVSHYVLSFSDTSALRDAEMKIHHLAFHDALTGLGNRHHLNHCLRECMNRRPSEGQPEKFALIFIDLDGFKTINDTLGHAVGDLLLIEIAARLSNHLRSTDVPIRLGGDEFVLILQSIQRPEDLISVADKLLVAIRQPVDLGLGEPVQVSASIGIALFPDHAGSVDDLIKAADSAMYAAKASGRDRYAFYSAALSARAVERMQIEQGLRRALGAQELRVLWQPVVSLRDGGLLGAEALLRWTHPEHGPIGPERFIPVAEETGLIDAIGDWVLREACGQAARWLKAGFAFERVAVNVSPRQLQHEGFAQRVEAALQQAQLAPEKLELELTESSLQSGDSVLRALHALRALGVKLALDDFGTGFSSLSMLKMLPIDRLKIDRGFVRDLARDPNDLAIARAIAALASTMDLAVTAEGVETAEQRDILLGMSVLEAQGWLYSPAVEAKELELWFEPVAKKPS
ncbi:diguanylate phosphodiesterase [Paucibacter sp. KBW04]|uniref:two-component system response regulator n=1 Tax=Paucibacter sp. KBW04 TaxID=2153361 RepID=UPI000F5890B0|nr:EAL domain-containing protein [Paucibacter sp. KBW04]RQO55626.1 diguanylate phosphodiesterase [Paucibacter sp. KBW04]